MTDVRLSRPGQATQPVAELPLRMPLPLHACNPWVASICWFSHRILVYIYIYIYIHIAGFYGTLLVRVCMTSTT